MEKIHWIKIGKQMPRKRWFCRYSKDIMLYIVTQTCPIAKIGYYDFKKKSWHCYRYDLTRDDAVIAWHSLDAQEQEFLQKSIEHEKKFDEIVQKDYYSSLNERSINDIQLLKEAYERELQELLIQFFKDRPRIPMITICDGQEGHWAHTITLKREHLSTINVKINFGIEL